MTDFWAVSTFWIVALLFVAIALAFVLPPLLKRHESQRGSDPGAADDAALQRSQLAELDADLRAGTLARELYDEARGELRDAAPAAVALPVGTGGRGRWAAYLLAGVVPVAAVAGYLALGSPSHLLPGAVPAAAASGQHDPEAMVAALEDRLQQHPDDGAGWAMLGRSYVALGRSQEGARAFARAVELTPGDARLLADYAEAVALSQNGSMAGVPANLVARALAIDGNDQKALMLAGVVANQGGDFAQAVAYWRRLLAMIPSDGELARQLTAAIATAQAAGAAGATARATAPAAGSISGTLTLSPQLAGKVNAADTVFIFAQAPQGPPMPLAVQRINASQLPYRFTLDDSMSMAGDRLSNHAQVMVTARLSKSGQPMPQRGDLQGRAGPVPMGQKGVALTIDTVVP